MKALITRTSNWDIHPEDVKEFNSLDELLAFQEEVKCSIIINRDLYFWQKEWGAPPDFQIEVYDDYRE